MELLSPAGSPAAVEAAVRHGADAVYLGFGPFHARRNAKNFSEKEAAAAVALCHAHGVKAYLTLNTLLTDRELHTAADTVSAASRLGFDAVLVQDLGALRLVQQVAPDLPVHASTQMSIHNLDGILQAADLGVRRVVLARELPKKEIAYLCAHSPVELEVFVHGALCMCYSGQCFFSSVIGGRSGNRGLCAQPCRLPYGWEDRADGYPLSLKDMSLAEHLAELEAMGVACIKIEGRMKRPDYVAVVTSVYARALNEKTPPSPEELARLRAVFSRQGFTDGYFMDQTGPAMFGIRDKASAEETAAARPETGLYQPPPALLQGVFSAPSPASGQGTTFAVEDAAGRRFETIGPPPEPAKTKGTTNAQIARQLEKTGGTPYAFSHLDISIAEGAFLSVSALNQLRRDALSGLTRLRTQPPRRRDGVWSPPAPRSNRPGKPGLTVSVKTFAQLTKTLKRLPLLQVYLPLEEAAAHLEETRRLVDEGIPAAVTLPRIIWDREWQTVLSHLDAVRAAGIETALIGNLGQLRPLRARGFRLRGDFGLNVFNSQTLEQLSQLGLSSATASFELRFAQIRDLSKMIDIELMVYGRLPLMLTQQCIIRNRANACGCENENTLVDRTGARFPVLPAFGCRNEIFNAKTLFLADKQAGYQKLGLWAARLSFTTEPPETCEQIAMAYAAMENAALPDDFTRGLYEREVE